MHARGHRSRWAAGGISVVLLMGGCTHSTPTAEPASSTTPASATSSVPLTCDAIEVRDLEAAPGDWILAEQVLVRGPEGTSFTATLPPDAPAGIAMGDSPTTGNSETRTTGLSVQRAAVTTNPASDLDPATLLAAIGQRGGDPLSLTNTSQDGFTGQLTGELGADGAVVYRGAQETTVSFTGNCSNPSEDPVAVTGSARYFTLGEAGVLDCAKPAEPGTLAEAATEFCTTE
ncbi:MAG: hypothetical protein WCF36_03180 [Candidatus Nanopelagicales bacterium]